MKKITKLKTGNGDKLFFSESQKKLIKKTIMYNKLIILSIFILYIILCLLCVLYSKSEETIKLILVLTLFYIPVSITRYGIFNINKLENVIDTLIQPKNEKELLKGLMYFTNKLEDHIYHYKIAELFGWYYEYGYGCYSRNDIVKELRHKEKEKKNAELEELKTITFNRYSKFL